VTNPQPGIIYVAYGQAARREAAASIRTLREHCALPVAVVGERVKGADCQLVFDEPGPGARWAKLNLDRLSPFERAVYVDADTRWRGGLGAGFEILADGWDLVIATSGRQGCDVMGHMTEADRALTLSDLGNCEPLQLQAGLFFFKRETTGGLFAAWRREWRRFREKDQGALLRALRCCPVRVWVLGGVWNRGGGEVVDHLFGTVNSEKWKVKSECGMEVMLGTKIFFDTEFTGLHQKTTLISIGCISEDGRKFYGEFTDYDTNQLDVWLVENVVKNLFQHSPSAEYGDLMLPEYAYIGDSEFIKEKLLDWFSQFGSVELWSDCLSFDWMLLSELIADRSNGYPRLPDNFLYHSPFDILTVFKVRGEDHDIKREDFAGIKDVEIREHNALWDAEVIKACYEKLMVK
jgi:hypothetical protein